ncbi:MAG: TPM domain-containing protein, partial [Flavobacteriaceae bacterium]|nr:TPM domain-containing protein [Flavobacteriaceae bacterium]
HIEKTTEKNALERAKEVFYFLKMDETEQQNGILFYIAVDDHKFSVLGDTGINKAVPEGFWNSIKDIVIQHFSSGNYVKGLQLAITQTGEKLKEFFPHQSRDSNELSDEISLGQF